MIDLFNQPQYFNSTQENKSDTEKFNAINAKENEIIIQVFKDFPQNKFTPFQIGDILTERGNNIIEINIKRCITTATKAGILINTGEKINERRGRKNYLWMLKKHLK
jgi:hypothetical protein